MPIAHSKLTAQGQISIPSQVRKRLGVGPGSVLEWDERDDEVVVRRAGRFSSADIHTALFPEGVPQARTTKQLREGIRKLMRKKYARS
jgi:AbrB family looped-hinge helix DNA binding protein